MPAEDADDAPRQVEQRTARVAGVEGRVGLDDLADKALVGALDHAPQGADDAHGQGALKAKGIADGHDELAHPQAA
jgi:hypothetical protein